LKVLINCSNLHGGGSAAIATSFLSYLSIQDNKKNIEYSIIVSKVVYANLISNNTDLSFFKNLKIKDFFGLNSIWQGIDFYMRGYDLVFTVMGPAYFIFKRTKHIFGFAHPWVIYPNNLANRKLSFLTRLFYRLKSKILILFFSRADRLIVELEHVEKGLRKISFFRKLPIDIVYSEVDEIFSKKEKWSHVSFPKTTGDYKIGIISRNYTHKNLLILPEVKKRVKSKFNINLDIFVTFSQHEWKSTSVDFQENIHNVGSLYLSQCPFFYSFLDAVIFPTLLECFSAVPIESMLMKKPLFASDLPFIKDICQNHCQYFNPIDIDNISDVIGNYFLSKKSRNNEIENAYKYVRKFSKHGNRGSNYMKIITDSLKRS
jgi:glycosyltransferase involved in cell wall biosynthesis